ncbi:hypothetical protein U9M48_013698, partial [Paspalum notatum var. saurae]
MATGKSSSCSPAHSAQQSSRIREGNGGVTGMVAMSAVRSTRQHGFAVAQSQRLHRPEGGGERSDEDQCPGWMRIDCSNATAWRQIKSQPAIKQFADVEKSWPELENTVLADSSSIDRGGEFGKFYSLPALNDPRIVSHDIGAISHAPNRLLARVRNPCGPAPVPQALPTRARPGSHPQFAMPLTT